MPVSCIPIPEGFAGRWQTVVKHESNMCRIFILVDEKAYIFPPWNQTLPGGVQSIPTTSLLLLSPQIKGQIPHIKGLSQQWTMGWKVNCSCIHGCQGSFACPTLAIPKPLEPSRFPFTASLSLQNSPYFFSWSNDLSTTRLDTQWPLYRWVMVSIVQGH